MNYLITESQIKRIIKKKFGLDLTDKISMVTNKWELPFEFDIFIPEKMLNRFLNNYGPMYVIETPKNLYLGQERENGWVIYDKKDKLVKDHQIMKELGIHGLGLSFSDLINAYIND
jgi:hypothetical protein